MNLPDSETDLIRCLARVGAGDRAAFGRLYDRSPSGLFALALGICRRRGLAEDVLQETYVRIWRLAAQYNPNRGDPMAWLAEPIQGGFVLRREEGEWVAFAAGIDRKILNVGTTGSSTALHRLAPGSVLDIHEHDLEEECYVVEGEIEVGGASFRAGDYIFVRRGGAHGLVRTRTGALLLIRGEA